MPGVDDTIFAVSSPPGRGWRAVVRLSGPDAIRVAASVVRLPGGEGPLGIPGHGVRDGDVLPWADGPPVPATLIVMRAPRSYTCEDVAEIHTLSSAPILAALSERILEAGARLAGPGEFTRRAFLSGRIDLSQAEAVVRVIEAEDETELRLAERKLQGGLSARVDSLKEELSDLLAQVEASIDFSEQGIDVISDGEVASRISALVAGIEATLGEEGSVEGSIRDSVVEVCLAGLPNVGKSSIFNRLIGTEAAIVTPDEGTTRDYLRSTIEEGGIRFRITDPAGIRSVEDPVEEEAVRRSCKLLGGADIAVVVVDGSQQARPGEEEIVLRAPLRSSLFVINKADLPRVRPEGGPVPEDRVIVTSALTGEGIPCLRSGLVQIARSGHGRGPGGEFLLAARERGLLRRAREDLRRATGIRKEGGADRLAADLRDALHSFGEISGEVTTDEILDRIFSRFCIGK